VSSSQREATSDASPSERARVAATSAIVVAVSAFRLQCRAASSSQRQATATSDASRHERALQVASASSGELRCACSLQPQCDKCAHGFDQSSTNSHDASELPCRWAILRCGHRRGKRCDVAAGCRHSEAHGLRSELALLSHLEWQPRRMLRCLVRLKRRPFSSRHPRFRKKNVVHYNLQKLAQNATTGRPPVVAPRISKINIYRYLLWEVLDATSCSFVLRTVRRGCQIVIQTFCGPFAVAARS
jgi:hypothetical protein